MAKVTSSHAPKVRRQVTAPRQRRVISRYGTNSRGVSLTAAASPVATPRGSLALPDPALAQEVPHDKEGHEQVDLPEADRDQHGIEEQSGQAQRQCETPGGHPVERRLDEAYGQNEYADQCNQVAHCPDRLHQSDTGERPLPGCEEECGERGIGERKARIGEDEGIQVGGEDVPSAQTQVDAEIHLVGPQRDVQAIRDGQRERHQRGTPPGQPSSPRGRTTRSVAAASQGLVDGCHGSSQEAAGRRPFGHTRFGAVT